MWEFRQLRDTPSLNAVTNKNVLLDIGGEVISRLETAGTRLIRVYTHVRRGRGAREAVQYYIF